MKPIAAAAAGLIRVYQWGLSPFLATQCRFLPSCSEYAREALIELGLLAGGWLGVRRICRCHPWGGCGYDPVPETPPFRIRAAFSKESRLQHKET